MMIGILLLIFILFMIIIFFLFIKPILTLEPFKADTKPYLWIYWENIKGKKTPPFILLCRESVYKHCKKSFQIILLNEKNIYQYLPELRKKEPALGSLLIAQKVDYYRVLLLHKFGGLYLDSDILVLRDPKEVVDKLRKYDFVGFGCNGKKCTYGYGKPSNWILASRPKGILISKVLHKLERKLSNKKVFSYHELGKKVFWEALTELVPQSYRYYHYPSEYDGSRDRFGRRVNNRRIFSNKYIPYKDPNKMIFLVMYNNSMGGFKNKSRHYYLNSNLNFTKFLNNNKNIKKIEK